MSIRTRFAPSPTGYLHIGGARTALFSWLYARKHGGRFVLRIEDTDLERSTAESVNAILEGMTWLGLDYDEGPFYQTQRFDRYKEVIDQLLQAGEAYYCYCSKERLEQVRADQMARKEKPRYDGLCRRREGPPPEGVTPVIRFKSPLDGDVVIDDIVRGKVVVSNTELDDLIIARSDGSPTYNLTVVVDDLDMEVSHVIRGDDHLNNTPRQINIMNALGAEPPRYAHVPMILGPDGKRLSKRHGAVSVMEFREQGFLPEAVINYLVRLGWSHGDQEIFELEELIQKFDVEDINHSASSVNEGKLMWLNQHYIKESDPAHIAHHLSYHLSRLNIDPSAGGPDILEVIKVQQERSKTLVEMAQGCVMFYQDFDEYEADAAKKHLRPVVREPLQSVRERLEQLDDWRPEALHQSVVDTAESFDIKMGKLGMPLRVAVSGTSSSPSIDMTLYLLGRERTLARIDKALAYIDARAAD